MKRPSNERIIITIVKIKKRGLRKFKQFSQGHVASKKLRKCVNWYFFDRQAGWSLSITPACLLASRVIGKRVARCTLATFELCSQSLVADIKETKSKSFMRIKNIVSKNMFRKLKKEKEVDKILLTFCWNVLTFGDIYVFPNIWWILVCFYSQSSIINDKRKLSNYDTLPQWMNIMRVFSNVLQNLIIPSNKKT